MLRADLHKVANPTRYPKATAVYYLKASSARTSAARLRYAIQRVPSQSHAKPTAHKCSCASEQALETASIWRRVTHLTLLVAALCALAMNKGAKLLYGTGFGKTEVALLFIMAGIATNVMAAKCMVNASENERLTSATYTRLNTGLALTGLAGILALGAAVQGGMAEYGIEAYKKLWAVHTTSVCILGLLMYTLYACWRYFQLQQSGVGGKNAAADVVDWVWVVFLAPLLTFWRSPIGGMFTVVGVVLVGGLSGLAKDTVGLSVRTQQVFMAVLTIIPLTCAGLLKSAADRGRQGVSTFRFLLMGLIANGLLQLIATLAWNAVASPTVGPPLLVRQAYVVGISAYVLVFGEKA